MQVSEKGDETGENQRTQKNKVGENVNVQPSHAAPSQKDACINMEINTSLSIPSQKGMDIENSSHLRAQNIGEGTKFTHITPMLEIRKELRNQRHLGSKHMPFPKLQVLRMSPYLLLLMHLRQMLRCSPTVFLFNLLLHILHLKFSLGVFIIDNMKISNSPSLKLKGSQKSILILISTKRVIFFGVSIFHFSNGF